METRNHPKTRRFVFVIEGNGLPTDQIQHLGIPRQLDELKRNNISKLEGQPFDSAATLEGRENFGADTDLLDFMSREIKHVEKQLDGSERKKLTHYLSAFESLRDRQSRIDGMEAALSKNAPPITDKFRSYHMSLIARLAERLQAIPEGYGTMLDNTTTVYLSDAAENHHSRCWEWSIIIPGGSPKNSPRFLNYHKYGNPGHRTIANFYTTLLHSAGAPRDHFGLKDSNLRDFNQYGPLGER